MLSNSARQTCFGAPGCLQWNSAVSSGAETSEVDSQELCLQPYSFHFNEVLESSPAPTTVEYFLYFPLHFSIDDYGQWMVLRCASCNQVVWGQSKLHYVEH